MRRRPASRLGRSGTVWHSGVRALERRLLTNYERPAVVGTAVDARHGRDVLVLPGTLRVGGVDERGRSVTKLNELKILDRERLPRLDTLNCL